MMRRELPLLKNWTARLGLALTVPFLAAAVTLYGRTAPQAASDVPPDATPQIQQISPSQAAPGTRVTVTIQGSSFSPGAYVSSVSPVVHVESSKRVSATQLEAQLSVSGSAQPSTVSLLVSNPASRAAETAFKITAGGAAPATGTPPPSAEPSKPATPAAPPAPSGPANPPPPAAPASPPPAVKPAAPPSPVLPVAPVAPSGPVVTTVQPSQVGRGFDVDLKITGKNFVPGTKVSFANPGIRVMSVVSPSPTELTVHLKVATDAAPGAGSLFVVNPDDSEVEAPFEVAGKGALAATTAALPSQPAVPAASVAEHYDAYHLGNPAEVFQVHGKVKGSLVVSSGMLRYQEDGKTLFSIAFSDIREIKTSSIATATFHVTLNSGKTYHFAPGSLRPGDARNLVDALRKDLPQ